MSAYWNERNLTRIQQSVEVRPRDVENLRRLLRGEQSIIRNQRNSLTILQVLKDFPQYRVNLYRNILGNAIRPNELELLDWLSVNKESAKNIADILNPFRSWLKSAYSRRNIPLSWRILSGYDN